MRFVDEFRVFLRNSWVEFALFGAVFDEIRVICEVLCRILRGVYDKFFYAALFRMHIFLRDSLLKCAFFKQFFVEIRDFLEIYWRNSNFLRSFDEICGLFPVL